MDLKNKGKFSVIYKEEEKKFFIAYNERGNVTILDKYFFADYDAAEDFINNNIQELDDHVTAIKEEEQRRIEEEEERRRQEEEERLRQEEEERIIQEEKQKRRKKFFYGFRRYIAGFLSAVILLVGGHFAGKGISSAIKNSKDSKVEDAADETDDLNVSNDINNIIEQDEELSVENFEKLVAEFAKPYVDNNVNVTTEDLTKFVSIVNIDKLVEENPEFAGELFGTQTKEEYLNDAAKIIGMTYTYNRNVFEAEQSTKNFLRISDAVYGSQKELLQEVESYVDKVAETRFDSEKCNAVISELILKLGDPTNDLSYLDDGVGFGMQVCIELIRSYLAKDVINQQNFDMLSTLTSSEEYVSNIFTAYDKCGSSYTKSRTK